MNHNVLCIGAGYVGGPTMAMIALKCPDCRVTVVDVNAQRIAAWNSGALPIYEPGLAEVVEQCRGRNLFFSTDIQKGIEENDIIFVAVNTPTKTFGHGAGYAADLQYWEKTARLIHDCAKGDKIVVEKCTLPVRTAAAMSRILHSGNSPHHFEVLSNPEFLAEGTAIADLENPDRVLVGADATPSGRKALKTVADIYANWVPRRKILTANVWSSELSKLAANALLAQRVSSVNALSALCEATEADIAEVTHAVGMDSRIGPKFLKAGVGFGGSCFKKDILNLVYLCETYNLHEAAAYWKQVVTLNDWQQDRFVGTVLQSMFNTVAGKRIALLGFAFKADTGDTRESPAIRVARLLAEERANVVVCDPQALDNARMDLADLGDAAVFEPDPYAATQDADAVMILTDWTCFRELDYARVYAAMRQPAFLFDGRNCVDHAALHKLGFNVHAIGKPALSHLR
ncbi:MAG TPA: nucleotide sugar dehydrogenase [Kiritimatiellia bacterium]|nr:nucleotide sugar dehydrogenase [Kiritimatiellia bacterium]HPS07271.1 nucleotide sugar dehydrogenase [Kiritimatiellia bacterium]